MNGLRGSLDSVFHGLAMAMLALVAGVLWAVYMGACHKQLHASFEAQVAAHSHSGSSVADAMQYLLSGHIHFMGIGVLVIAALIMVALTSLKPCWKQMFGWTFGLGALLYPPAWILMGFRTVELGPQGAQASVIWLLGPGAGLLIGSLIALLAAMLVECIGLKKRRLFSWVFVQ